MDWRLRSELLHDLTAKSGQVGRLPRRNEVPIHNDLAVEVASAGVPQFRGDGFVAGRLPSFYHSGAHEDLRAVTDGGDGFVGGVEGSDDPLERGVASQRGRCPATGQDEEVVISRFHFRKRPVDRYGVSVFAPDASGAGRRHIDRDTFLSKTVQGYEELRILKVIGAYDQRSHIAL